MKTFIEHQNASHNGRTIAGIIILIIGGLLLVDQLNLFFIPNWLFSWPMWLIGWGVYMGGKYNFKKPVWIIMILIGSAFLLTENIHNADRIVWPLALISYGTYVVLKHNKPKEVVYPANGFNEPGL